MIEVALGTGVVIEMAIHGMDATAAETRDLTMFYVVSAAVVFMGLPMACLDKLDISILYSPSY